MISTHLVQKKLVALIDHGRLVALIFTVGVSLLMLVLPVVEVGVYISKGVVLFAPALVLMFVGGCVGLLIAVALRR